MIYGFNTEVEHKGTIFHVQTSDKGQNKPVVETLVYVGGEVKDTRRTNYANLIKRGYDEKKVIKLMEAQHRRVIFAVKKGALDEVKEGQEPAPVEKELLQQAQEEGKDLDDMILEYLSAQPEQEQINIVLSTASAFVTGQAAFMRLLTSTSVTRKPVNGAKVSVVLRDNGADEVLYEGTTDEDGEATVMVIIPQQPSITARLLIRAECELGKDEVSQPILPAA